MNDRTASRAWWVRARAATLGFVAATGIACSQVQVPAVPPPPEPFTRYPYLQAVTDSSAELLWETRAGVVDTVDYWVAGSSDTARVLSADTTARRHVRLEDLAPRTTVRYRVATGVSDGAVAEHDFTTAPLRGADTPVRVLVFGDSGSGSDAQVQLSRLMEPVSPDLILHTGDVAYPVGSEFDLTERHFRVYQNLLAQTPFFPSTGNHDVLTDNGRPYREAFVFPRTTTSPDAPRTRYYSFDWGRVHFVALDSTEGDEEESGLNLRAPGHQREWLERDLARAAADLDIDWIVVFMHHPPFSSAKGLMGHGSDEELRQSLTPLFDQHGVDLVFSGHDHLYERTHPIRDGSIPDDGVGTTYVLTGGGGGDQTLRAIVPEWFSAASAVDFHFVTLDVRGTEMLLRVHDLQGDVIDRHRIRRVDPGP